MGAFAIKLASRSNLHPIIAVAGAGADYVRSLLDASRGDTVVDYRAGRLALEASIRAALDATIGEGANVSHAIDAITDGSSSEVCARFLRRGGRLAHLMPLWEDGIAMMPEGTEARLVNVGDVHGHFGEENEARDFGHVMMQAFARGLDTGWLHGHPFEVRPGGLEAAQGVLDSLKAGRASAVKFLVRVGEEMEGGDGGRGGGGGADGE